LNLQCDEPLSNHAFNLNVRRYAKVQLAEGLGHMVEDFRKRVKAGADTRPLSSSP
jgi:hypothetical protein